MLFLMCAFSVYFVCLHFICIVFVCIAVLIPISLIDTESQFLVSSADCNCFELSYYFKTVSLWSFTEQLGYYWLKCSIIGKIPMILENYFTKYLHSLYIISVWLHVH